MRLLKEKCTLSYYKYPFPIFQNFPIISTPQSQKTRALTIIRGVLIIGNKEYIPAILSPKVTPTCCSPTARIGHGVAAHLGWNTKPSFHIVIGKKESFPEKKGETNNVSK